MPVPGGAKGRINRLCALLFAAEHDKIEEEGQLDPVCQEPGDFFLTETLLRINIKGGFLFPVRCFPGGQDGRKGGNAMINARSKAFDTLLAALLALFAVLFPLTAHAQSLDMVAFTMEASGTELSGPGEIQISARVTNTSDQDMAYPVSLYGPSGDMVSAFGENGSVYLKAGQYFSWSGTYAVTEEDLDRGSVTFTVRYNMEDAEGNIYEVMQEAGIVLTYLGERVSLSVTRTLEPEVCRSGKVASVIYDLVNSGNVELTDIKVTESMNGRTQTVGHLSPGGSQKVTFTATIQNTDLTSSAKIEYKAEGEKETFKKEVEAVTIPVAKPDLKMSLSAVTPNVNIGETAIMRITFINNGNVSYSNVTVRDAKKGEVLTGIEIPAGTTVERDKEFTLTEPTTFKFTALLSDNTGETREMTSESIPVQVYDPQNTLILTLDLTCDHETLSELPAVVRFTLNVTNNADNEAKNIKITHGSVNITNIASIAAGQTVKLERDVQISHTGQFRFTASASDSLGNSLSFQSNTVQLSYALPTAEPTSVPVPTVAPLVTEPPVTEEDLNPMLVQGRQIARLLAMIFAGLLAAGLILLIAAAVSRAVSKKRSDSAYDHLDLAARRDYGRDPDAEEDDDEAAGEAEKEEAPSVVRGDRDEVTEEEVTTLRSGVTRAMVHDPLDVDAPEPEVTEEDVVKAQEKRGQEQEAYEDDGFRVSRRRAEAPAEESTAKEPEPPAKEQPAEEEDKRQRRAARRRRNVQDGE